jgi:peptidoglycan/xylan/chitin deacetylase (PgdA/CDA1 family)
MNTTDSTGDQFHLEDLHGLVGDGHELASHTCHHVSSRSLSVAAFVQEVLEGKEGMRRVAGLKVSNNFAYPFGRVTAAAKYAVGKAMRSCRGSYPGVNGSLVDLSLLRANPLYGDTEKLGLIRRLLQVNQECGGWIIFYTHDVSNIHSPWGCTPALLEAVVKLALSSSMKILTVKEVLGDPQTEFSQQGPSKSLVQETYG